MQRAYLASTRVLSAVLLLVGVAMVGTTLARGGGALAFGVVLGTLVALLGAGRLYLAVAHAHDAGEDSAGVRRGGPR